MLDARRLRLNHRHTLALAFALLLALVVLVGVVLVRDPAPLPAANAAADCGPAAGATARGYGESGAGGVTSSGYGESGAGGVTGDTACAPDCKPSSGGGSATGRGYGESGAGGVTGDTACVAPASAPPSTPSTEAVSAPDGADDAGTRAVSTTPPPTSGGGGATIGRVPGATGRDAPKASDEAKDERATAGLHREPLGASVVAQAAVTEDGRRNTAIVVGGLALLVAGVAVVLRRGRSGPSW